MVPAEVEWFLRTCQANGLEAGPSSISFVAWVMLRPSNVGPL